MKKRSIVIYTFFVLFLLLSCGLMLGCGAKDSGNIEEKPTVSPPSFQVAPATSGGGIIFYATPDKDVTLTKIVVTPPVGSESYTIPYNNNLYVAKTTITILHYDNYYGWVPFPKLGGTWSFVFTGNLSSTKEQFTVTVTVKVSA